MVTQATRVECVFGDGNTTVILKKSYLKKDKNNNKLTTFSTFHEVSKFISNKKLAGKINFIKAYKTTVYVLVKTSLQRTLSAIRNQSNPKALINLLDDFSYFLKPNQEIALTEDLIKSIERDLLCAHDVESIYIGVEFNATQDQIKAGISIFARSAFNELLNNGFSRLYKLLRRHRRVSSNKKV